MDTALQSLAITGLSIFADMIRNSPRDAVGIGLKGINDISSFLLAKCSNKDDPNLKKAMSALDSALSFIDEQILESMKAGINGMTLCERFNPLTAQDPALRASLTTSLSVWIILRNLQGQPNAGVTVTDPALGGRG